jgi:hypothetical protein
MNMSVQIVCGSGAARDVARRLGRWVSASVTVVLCNRFLWMVFRQIAVFS